MYGLNKYDVDKTFDFTLGKKHYHYCLVKKNCSISDIYFLFWLAWCSYFELPRWINSDSMLPLVLFWKSLITQGNWPVIRKLTCVNLKLNNTLACTHTNTYKHTHTHYTLFIPVSRRVQCQERQIVLQIWLKKLTASFNIFALINIFLYIRNSTLHFWYFVSWILNLLHFIDLFKAKHTFFIHNLKCVGCYNLSIKKMYRPTKTSCVCIWLRSKI